MLLSGLAPIGCRGHGAVPSGVLRQAPHREGTLEMESDVDTEDLAAASAPDGVLNALVDDVWFDDVRAAIASQHETAETDGRRLRRSLNREAVVDALLDLYDEGNLQPSTDEIAERAGISPRSLFRYFDDTDDLIREAVARQQMRVLPLIVLEVAKDAPLAERARVVADQRVRLFAKTLGAGTVTRLRAPFNPMIAEYLTIYRTLLRRQVQTLFAPELAALPDDRAETALAAADVLLSFESYRLLTSRSDVDDDRARVLLCDAVTALLSPGGSR